MPDKDGKIKGISVPKVPWLEPKPDDKKEPKK